MDICWPWRKWKQTRPKLKQHLLWRGRLMYLAFGALWAPWITQQVVPRLSEVSEPLRPLTKKETVFLWDEIHDRAFSRTKGVLTAPLVLKYYEWEKDLVSQGDASEGGLGAALLQDGRPLVYASREELCPNRERTSCDRVCNWKVSPVYL